MTALRASARRTRLAALPGLVLLAAVAGLSAGCATATGVSPRRAAVMVRAMYREVPAAGVRVEWRTLPAPGSPVAAVAVTDNAGIARFELPDGKYFLLAHVRADGDIVRPPAPGDRFGYYGGNPVYVAGGRFREFYLSIDDFDAPPPAAGGPASGTGVSGVVTSGGVPVQGAVVQAHLRGDAGFHEIGFAASAPTDAYGAFALDLPPGAYYLIVRMRASGGAGPLRKGDRFGYFPGNPVMVDHGFFTRVAIPATTLKTRNTPPWSGDYPGAAVLEGRILGPDGRPRQGVYAALYDNPDLLNRPVFLSEPVGADGRYRLAVLVPGRYYLGARTGYGGSPVPGSLYGRYEGSPDHAVTVHDGDRLTGFDLVVREVR